MDQKENPSFSRFTSLRDVQPTATALEAIVREIGDNTHAAVTARYREIVHRLDDDQLPAAEAEALQTSKTRIKSGQPAFIVSVIVEGGRSAAHITGYTGCVMVDIDNIPTASYSTVRQQIRSDIHSLLTHTSISGRGIRIISLVEGITDKNTFAEAWKAVNEYYARLTGIEVDSQCKNATRMSVICHDPEVQYRPDATPFTVAEVRQATEARKAETNRRKAATRAEKLAKKHRHASPEQAYITITDQLEKEGMKYAAGTYNAYVSRCFYWMNRYGIPQEDTEAWAIRQFPDYPADQLLPVVKSCYALTAEHGIMELPDTGGPRKRKASVEEMEDFICGYMHIRKNMLTHQLEVQLIGDGTEQREWTRLTDEEENTLWCDMERSGMEVDMHHLRTLLTSSYPETYHPLLDYLQRLPEWDGTTDYIRQLADMVHVKDNPQCLSSPTDGESPVSLDFTEILRHWLVAMIAAALNDDVVNQVMIVFIGPQGCFKTSFTQNILPPELRAYFVIKSDFDRFNKDDLFTLTEKLIINLDEIDEIKSPQLNQIKSIVTKPYVDERPAYGRNKEHLPHVASFVATGNNQEFLTDYANRRWFPFEIDHIDNPWETTFPYEGIYAQAYALYQRGYRYWFTSEEIKSLSRHVRKFEIPKPEFELILTYYRKPQDQERGTLITCAQILERFNSSNLHLTMQKVGRAMKTLDFKKIHTKGANYWYVVERTPEDVQHNLPEEEEAKPPVKEEQDLPF